MTKIKAKILSYYSLIFVVYAGIVVTTIQRSSIWHDESFTALIIHFSPKDIIARTALDVHPPLYYLALKLWASLFGYTTLSLRLFSSACMFLAITLLLQLLRKIGIKNKLVVGAGFVLVLAPYVLRYSVEARMYALGALLAVVATGSFLAILKAQNTGIKLPKIQLAIYILSAAGLLYTQYFLAFIVVGHFVWFLLHTRRELYSNYKKWLNNYKYIWAAFVACGLLFLPWVPTAIRQVSEVQGGFWISPIGGSTLFDTLGHLFGLQPILDYGPLETAVLMLGLIGLGVLSVKGYLKLDIVPRQLVKTFMTVFVTCVGILFVISLPPLQPLYHNRYLMVPAFFMYAALGICIAAAPRKNKVFLLLMILPLLFLSIFRVYTEGVNYDRGHGYFAINDVGKYVRDNAQPDDIVLSTGLWTYFDATQHFLVDHPGKIRSVYLYQPDNINHKTGNRSLIYDNDTLIIRPGELCGLVKPGASLWLLDESAGTKIDNIPSTWQTTDKTITKGYAKVSRLTVLNGKCALIKN